MDIRELAKVFTGKPGNDTVSPEMLVNFYNEIASAISIQDPYQKIAEICNLEETEMDGIFKQRGRAIYFEKTKFGFIQMRSKF